MTNKMPTYAGVVVEAWGDSEGHTLTINTDVSLRWDEHSQVLTLILHETQLDDLYWFALETMPKLRKDRR